MVREKEEGCGRTDGAMGRKGGGGKREVRLRREKEDREGDTWERTGKMWRKGGGDTVERGKGKMRKEEIKERGKVDIPRGGEREVKEDEEEERRERKWVQCRIRGTTQDKEERGGGGKERKKGEDREIARKEKVRIE